MTSWSEDFKRAFHAVYEIHLRNGEVFGGDPPKKVLAADEDSETINGRLLVDNNASVLDAVEVRKDNVSVIREDLDMYRRLYNYNVQRLYPNSLKMRLTLHEHLNCAACQTNERVLGERYCEGCGKELSDDD